MMKIFVINITAGGTPQPNLGEAVYILMISPQFSSVKLHSHNHRRFSWLAGRLTGKPASYRQSKVAVVRGLLGDVEVLPMVVIEGRCGLKVRGQHPGWEG